MSDPRESKLPKWAQEELRHLRREIARRDDDIKSLVGQKLPAKAVLRGSFREPHIPISSPLDTLLWNLDGEWDENDMEPSSNISIDRGVLELSMAHRFDNNLLYIRSVEGGLKVLPATNNGILVGVAD